MNFINVDDLGGFHTKVARRKWQVAGGKWQVASGTVLSDQGSTMPRGVAVHFTHKMESSDEEVVALIGAIMMGYCS